MYALYAEDTSQATRPYLRLKGLESRRFSRAMKEARKNKVPGTIDTRPFVALDTESYISVADRNYLDMPVSGSPAHQAQMRSTLQRQVRPSTHPWDEPNSQGETLGEIYVDMIRRQAKAGDGTTRRARRAPGPRREVEE